MNQAHALRSTSLGLLVALTSAWQPAHTAYKSLAAPRAYKSLALAQRRRPPLRAEPGDEPPAYDLLADIERFKREKAAADAAAGLPAAPAPTAAAPPPAAAAPAPAMAFDAAPPAPGGCRLGLGRRAFVVDEGRRTVCGGQRVAHRGRVRGRARAAPGA